MPRNSSSKTGNWKHLTISLTGSTYLLNISQQEEFNYKNCISLYWNLAYVHDSSKPRPNFTPEPKPRDLIAHILSAHIILHTYISHSLRLCYDYLILICFVSANTHTAALHIHSHIFTLLLYCLPFCIIFSRLLTFILVLWLLSL